MSLFDQFISILAPHSCVGCGYEGSLICVHCTDALEKIPDRCYRCRKVSPGSRTCQTCRHSSKLSRVSAATVYEGTSKELVWQLKFQGAQAAAAEMARLMLPLLHADRAAVVMPVPTATSRVRQRGYDQARLLAKELARQARMPYIDCLKRRGQAHQVGASRQQRLRQLQTAFRVYNTGVLRNKSVVLIDDVVTTGATLEAAAAVLKKAGIREISAVVFTQP